MHSYFAGWLDHFYSFFALQASYSLDPSWTPVTMMTHFAAFERTSWHCSPGCWESQQPWTVERTTRSTAMNHCCSLCFLHLEWVSFASPSLIAISAEFLAFFAHPAYFTAGCSYCFCAIATGNTGSKNLMRGQCCGFLSLKREAASEQGTHRGIQRCYCCDRKDSNDSNQEHKVMWAGLNKLLVSKLVAGDSMLWTQENSNSVNWRMAATMGSTSSWDFDEKNLDCWRKEHRLRYCGWYSYIILNLNLKIYNN